MRTRLIVFSCKYNGGMSLQLQKNRTLPSRGSPPCLNSVLLIKAPCCGMKLETEAWGDLWFKTLSILFRKISGTVPSPTPAADSSSVSHQCSFQLWDRDSFGFHMNILNSSQAHNFNKNVVFTVYPFLNYFGKVWETDQKGTKKNLPSKLSWDGLTLFLLRSKCQRSSKEQDE